MNISANKFMAGEKGFTLVELAIVMVIIGLLIGGILKGQEMIKTARINATVSQIKGIDAAVSTFRDMYDALPGDMLNASTRLPTCTGECTNNGDGNQNLDDGIGHDDDETMSFWAHLNAADLITGVDMSGVAAWGQGLPAAKIAGGFSVGYHPDGDVGGIGTGRGGHYIALLGTPKDDDSPALSIADASRIDRKLDDGTPGAGSVIAIDGGSSGTECEEIDSGTGTGTGKYNEAVSGAISCALAIRIQG